MIHEPEMTPFICQKVIKANDLDICCGHDFWDKVKIMQYGDTVLCTRCYQYFAKIKDLVWLIEDVPYAWDSKKMKHMGIMAAHTAHLPPKYFKTEEVWLVRVPIRVTN